MSYEGLTCGRNVSTGSKPFKCCGKPAVTWYVHDYGTSHDICAYCSEHDYACGKKIHLAIDPDLPLLLGEYAFIALKSKAIDLHTYDAILWDPTSLISPDFIRYLETQGVIR